LATAFGEPGAKRGHISRTMTVWVPALRYASAGMTGRAAPL